MPSIAEGNKTYVNSKTKKMKKNTLTKQNLLLAIAAIIAITTIAIDQYSKYFVLTKVNQDPFVILPFLNIVSVWNKGISFGILSNTQYSNILFFCVATLIVSFLIYLSFKDKGKNILPYSLIIGGGIANIIDRINYGAVFDFIDFHIGKYHWPAFNVADSAIFIGIVFLLLNLKEEK